MARRQYAAIMDSLRPGNGVSCPSLPRVLGSLESLSQDEDVLFNLGTFSPSIYDTAWLSMVPLSRDNQTLRYPQCLQHLLDTQEKKGTWPTYASQIDGILNTLAATLALISRSQRLALDSDEYHHLHERILRAADSLPHLLNAWRVEETVHVGFEFLVVSLLEQLEKFGYAFSFAGKEILLALRSKKLVRFSPDILYSRDQTTLAHSLEAFIGLIDFDKVGHHCMARTGMLGSPASTAAYLTNASRWNPDAATYLDKVFDAYGRTGAIPNAFPTSLFEVTWAISSIFSPVFRADWTSSRPVKLLDKLYTASTSHRGLVGFAPGILPDADDTARLLLTLIRSGYDTDESPMIERFEGKTCFKTYEHERNPSFTANCNVALAILEHDSPKEHTSQLQKALQFILTAAESLEIRDKWNISPQYSDMLLVEVLLAILIGCDQRALSTCLDTSYPERAAQCLRQKLLRTLSRQKVNGSWADSLESTSYGTLLLVQTSALPWAKEISREITDAIVRARGFIEHTYPVAVERDFNWVEKTTFQPSLLFVAYCSVAMNATVVKQKWSEGFSGNFRGPDVDTTKMTALFNSLPLISDAAIPWNIILLEASDITVQMNTTRLSVFPRDTMPLTKDKYAMYIPVIWLAANFVSGQTLPSSVIGDMVSLSLLNYQADEYMETIVDTTPPSEGNSLLETVSLLCGLERNSSRYAGTYDAQIPTIAAQTTDTRAESPNSHASAPVIEVLSRYIARILEHPAVVESPTTTRRMLAMELFTFLRAHFRHNQDNRQYKARQSESVSMDYVRWVQSTGAEDTSCPFSFHFFTCLISNHGTSCLAGSQAQYYGRSLAQHLAVMCRQYNDYGSRARDKAEQNLNSLDFEIFHAQDDVDERRAKDEVMAIAQFERASMDLALRTLSKVLPSKYCMDAIGVFIKVTDLFGQIYVCKDIASRKKKTHTG